MADVPDTLTLKRNRDLVGLHRHPWPRWIVLGAITLFAILGLLNVFGQRPSVARAATPRAELTLYSPTHLRGGLLYTARFHITARQDLKKATLILDPGWVEGMAVNTIEPSPIGEASEDGRLSFDLGHIPAGKSYLLFMQFQVNPTNIAWRRPAGVQLDDGDISILRIDRSYTIFP